MQSTFVRQGTVIIGFVVFLSLFWSFHQAPAVSSPRPNIIVIMTDDQDARSFEEMPAAYRLGKTGTTFLNSFVTTSLCCPSRSTFLTGQYSHNHGVVTNDVPEGGYGKLDHTKTLAVWLQNAGYHTAMIGKYLNGYGSVDANPLDGNDAAREIPPGWNEWYAILGPAFFNYTMNENRTLVTYGNLPDEYSTDVFARKAIDYVRRQAGQAQPFFLYLNFFAPHSGAPSTNGPEPAPRHKDRLRYLPTPKAPGFNELDVSDKPSFISGLPKFGDIPSKAWALHERFRRRRESLMAVDEAVMGIEQILHATGQWDNTLIIFTSDNGFFQGEHRIKLGKVLPHEPSIRVPLLIRGPGVMAEQTRSELVSNVDLAATILEFAQAAPNLTQDGRSLAPLLENIPTPWRTSLLVEFRGSAPKLTGGEDGVMALPFSGVRTDRYLYVEYQSGDREFYDLLGDPYQLQNLDASTDTNHVTLKDQLRQKLNSLRDCVGMGCFQ